MTSFMLTEESFRRIFHDSPTGMVLGDLDLQVIDANPAFAAFLGRKIEDIVGRSVATYSEPGDMLRTRRNHEELLAGTTGHYSMEKRYVRADGSLVWGEITVSLLRDDRGRPVATYAQVQDISARKLAVEALDRRARYNEAAAELGRIALVAADVGELAERARGGRRRAARRRRLRDHRGQRDGAAQPRGARRGAGARPGRALDDARALAGRARVRHRRAAGHRRPRLERGRRLGAAARLRHAQRDGHRRRGPRRPRGHGRGVQPPGARVDGRRIRLPARGGERHGLGDRARGARGRPPSTARCTTRSPACRTASCSPTGWR